MTSFFQSDAVRQDANARTLSYYATKDIGVITPGIVDELVTVSNKHGGNARLCLHQSPEDGFHEMLILERPEARFYQPHKHADKGESWHILRGSVGVFCFNDDGKLIHRVKLDPKGNILCRCSMNTWHTVVPLSEYAVYLECKPGPFRRERDAMHAPWAPDGSDPAEAKNYIQSLIAQL